MNSLNHYAYGSIVEWMFRDMCGLNPSSCDEGIVGFRHARIAPKPDKSLQWAKARYCSAAGFYESSWHIDETNQITIPFNASASVVLPDVLMDAVTSNAQSLQDAEQIGDNVEITLGAGEYTFAYMLR